MEHENGQPQERRSKREKRKRGPLAVVAGAIGRLFSVVFTLCLIGVLTAGMIGYLFMQYVETNITPIVHVDADDYVMELSSIIYYQDNETGAWNEYQTIHGGKNRIYVTIDQIPDALWQAAVAIEDQRFFQHEGVDWIRTAHAMVNMFTGRQATFGGSTITQQLLKNMTEEYEGTINRKVREIFRALEFEKNYTKEEILELYLNTIYLGKDCWGVQTAAQYYFGKDVSELSVAECASLIAITNNPSMYGPKYNITITRDNGSTATPRELNKERQTLILNKMGEVGEEGTVEDGYQPFLTKAEVAAAKAETLQFTDSTTSADEITAAATGGVKINNWFVDQVIRDVREDLAEALGVSEKTALTRLYNSGYRIYTTMDLEIQKIAESIYRDRSNLDVTSRNGQQLQSAITIIDPYTGDIVATVGKVGEKTENLGWNYAIDKQQPGSSIKPLTVYAPAIDAGAVTPATTFDDYPVQLMNGNPWPKNSPSNYKGWTTVAEGLRRSVNTIAVQTLQAVGTAEAYAFATEKLNLSLVPEDMDISPLGMGGLTYGLSTVEMAAGYAAFVNQGVYNEPRTYVRVEDAEGRIILQNDGNSHIAMQESTAALMNNMLKSVVTSGTGTSANFGGMTIAGKTGTTSDNYDRYFVGYTPYYVAAVWTGYKNNEKISYNGNPAITMWKLVMQQIHEGLENKDFTSSEGLLTTITVCADSGLLCTDTCRADLRGSRATSVTVAKGTAPTGSCTMHIVQDYCKEGKCLATPLCTPESITKIGVLDYQRENYGVSVGDSAYLLSSLQNAQTTIGEDGQEIVGCPVHATATVPEEEPPLTDPENPEGVTPPVVGEGDEPLIQPEEPTVPGTPPEEPPANTGSDIDWTIE